MAEPNFKDPSSYSENHSCSRGTQIPYTMLRQSQGHKRVLLSKELSYPARRKQEERRGTAKLANLSHSSDSDSQLYTSSWSHFNQVSHRAVTAVQKETCI